MIVIPGGLLSAYDDDDNGGDGGKTEQSKLENGKDCKADKDCKSDFCQKDGDKSVCADKIADDAVCKNESDKCKSDGFICKKAEGEDAFKCVKDEGGSGGEDNKIADGAACASANDVCKSEGFKCLAKGGDGDDKEQLICKQDEGGSGGEDNKIDDGAPCASANDVCKSAGFKCLAKGGDGADKDQLICKQDEGGSGGEGNKIDDGAACADANGVCKSEGFKCQKPDGADGFKCITDVQKNAENLIYQHKQYAARITSCAQEQNHSLTEGEQEKIDEYKTMILEENGFFFSNPYRNCLDKYVDYMKCSADGTMACADVLNVEFGQHSDDEEPDHGACQTAFEAFLSCEESHLPDAVESMCVGLAGCTTNVALPISVYEGCVDKSASASDACKTAMNNLDKCYEESNISLCDVCATEKAAAAEACK